jgi:hypothetical protein
VHIAEFQMAQLVGQPDNWALLLPWQGVLQSEKERVQCQSEAKSALHEKDSNHH